MELTFSHFGYCLISCLELTFRELTLFVLSYFQLASFLGLIGWRLWYVSLFVCMCASQFEFLAL